MATESKLIRFEKEELDKFLAKYPWHGSLSQLCNQVLKDFNELTKDVPSPAGLATRATANVIQKHY